MEILKNASSIKGFRELQLMISKDKLDEAIKELEAHIAGYQVIRKRLDNTVITLADL